MNTLQELAEKYKTDKAHHGYCVIYDKKLSARRDEPLNILEIGVYMGGSLRVWREYFPNATIHGMDVNIERCGEVKGCSLHKIDVANTQLLEELAVKYGPWDLIIDDGSHTMKHQQHSFDVLWPHVKPGGFFIIEDIHTSFMPKFALHSADTSKHKEATYFMAECIKYKKHFHSSYITKERVDLHSKSVKHVTIWVRNPTEHVHQLSSTNNSMTSMFLKCEAP